MPIGWWSTYEISRHQPPRIGGRKRDRGKAKASRAARRRTRRTA